MPTTLRMFSLDGALRRLERFKPLTAAQMDSLVAAIHDELDKVEASRDVIEFGRLGEIGPRPVESI